jgi:hypothetical protein
MKINEEKVVHVPPYEASEKDWKDFFEGEDISEDAFGSVDSDDEWLCVASQHGRIQLQQTDERLAEAAKKPKGPPIGYEFDR